MTHLTQRDRIMVAEVIRRYLARDIEAREITPTYDPAVLSVTAFELADFANELIHCCDCDAEDLAEGVARDIAEAAEDIADDPDAERSQDIAELLPPLPSLRKLEDASYAGVALQRNALDR